MPFFDNTGRTTRDYATNPFSNERSYSDSSEWQERIFAGGVVGSLNSFGMYTTWRNILASANLWEPNDSGFPFSSRWRLRCLCEPSRSGFRLNSWQRGSYYYWVCRNLLSSFGYYSKILSFGKALAADDAFSHTLVWVVHWMAGWEVLLNVHLSPSRANSRRRRRPRSN